MKPKKLTRVERRIVAIMKLTNASKFENLSAVECITLWRAAMGKEAKN